MKVLVIGSGPIVIGQAAEFDYAGTQACKSLKEEGHEVVLINSNPATIMTDPGVADALYIEPLNLDFCTRVIERERPDALLPTLGGQTGLNLATQLQDAGVLEKYNVRVLGTPLSAIKKAEDRESFRALMHEIREPVPESWIVTNEDELRAILDVVPYPCIIRPAYTLGGTGGGIADTPDDLWEIGRKGLKLSMRSQLMVERSLLGWKEVEYEVMRDSNGTVITVCNMENLDPMGVHTGDSIVVAPSQTLSDLEYHMMRTASLKIITALGIEGGCNVQMALHPDSFDYYIIEVNPRVSRSSALASKATGYPIARVAAKIAVGRTLDEIENGVTGTTVAAFEPALDYCVVKIPRWPFDKFPNGDRSLFTQMKATGEVMAIDRSFEAALMKAIRGLEVRQKDLRHERWVRTPHPRPLPSGEGRGVSDLPLSPLGERGPGGEGSAVAGDSVPRSPGSPTPVGGGSGGEFMNADPNQALPGSETRGTHRSETDATSDDALRHALRKPTDERLWALAEALRRGWGVDETHKWSRVDKWFLRKIATLVEMEGRLARLHEHVADPGAMSATIEEAFLLGFPSPTIESILGITPEYRRDLRAFTRANFLRGGEGLQAVRIAAGTDPEGSTHVADVIADESRGELDADTFFAKYPSNDPRWAMRLYASGKIAKLKVAPVFKMVDTCAGEFESRTPYYYGTFESEHDSVAG